MTDPREQLGALMTGDRWTEATELASALTLDPAFQQDSEVFWNLGWCHFKLGHLEQAVTAFHQSLALEPYHPCHHWALGVVLGELGQDDEAEWYMLRGLAIKDAATMREHLALLYMRRDDFSLAEGVHLGGLQLKPGSRRRIEAYVAFLRDADRDAEADEWERKLTASPGVSAPIAAPASRPTDARKEQLAQLWRARRWREGIQLASSLLHDPVLCQDSEVSWRLGWCHFELDETEQALCHLRRAMDLDRGDILNHWGLGHVLAAVGQTDEAELHLLRGLALGEVWSFREALAFLYCDSQDVPMAERVHLEGLRLEPKNHRKIRAYVEFLRELERDAEADEWSRQTHEPVASEEPRRGTEVSGER